VTTHTVRADAPPKVLTRAALLAWLDEDTLELVPVVGLGDQTSTARRSIEEFMASLNTSVNWVGPLAEFIPADQEAVK
jgi:hypothetical protein